MILKIPSNLNTFLNFFLQGLRTFRREHHSKVERRWSSCFKVGPTKIYYIPKVNDLQNFPSVRRKTSAMRLAASTASTTLTFSSFSSNVASIFTCEVVNTTKPLFSLLITVSAPLFWSFSLRVLHISTWKFSRKNSPWFDIENYHKIPIMTHFWVLSPMLLVIASTRFGAELAWSTHEDGEEEIVGERDLKNRSFSATAESRLRMAIHYLETSFAFFAFVRCFLTFCLEAGLVTDVLQGVISRVVCG